MTQNIELIWIWLSILGRPAGKILSSLREAFQGDFQTIWEADTAEKLPRVILQNKELAARLLDKEKRQQACKIYETCLHDRMRITFLDKEDYPALLRQIHNPPLVLYYFGRLPPRKKSMPLISVVGSRRCTIYGKNMVYKLAGELAYCGLGIVSGLAKGIDARAHEGALAADGYTIGVLGSGADVIYPFENIHLYYKVREFGCVMSEYPPGTQPLKNHFPARNRIIAGLSLGTFVCEAAKSSGSMITVERALEENRQIYAMPGNIDSEYSVGTNALIKNCAVCVTGYKDILDDLGFVPERVPMISPVQAISGLEGNLAVVAQAIYDGNHTIEKLLQVTGCTLPALQTALTILEIRSIIKRTIQGDFIFA